MRSSFLGHRRKKRGVFARRFLNVAARHFFFSMALTAIVGPIVCPRTAGSAAPAKKEETANHTPKTILDVICKWAEVILCSGDEPTPPKQVGRGQVSQDDDDQSMFEIPAKVKSWFMQKGGIVIDCAKCSRFQLDSIAYRLVPPPTFFARPHHLELLLLGTTEN